MKAPFFLWWFAPLWWWHLFSLLPTFCHAQSSTTTTTTTTESNTLAKLILNRPDLSVYYTAIAQFSDILEYIESTNSTATVLAPSDDMLASDVMFTTEGWLGHLREFLKKSIVPGEAISSSQLFDESRAFIPTLGESIQVNARVNQLERSRVIGGDLTATNGILHILDKPLLPAFMDETFASLLERRNEYGSDGTTPSVKQIVELTGGQNVLEQMVDTGGTFLGCDVSAVANVDSDLSDTLNGAASVLNGEFLNASDATATLNHFVQYSFLPESFYMDSLSDGFVGVTYPVADCGHMLVTRTGDKLCFNNACVVTTPSVKEYLTGNGVAFVTDKCLVCPGAGMLVQYAFEYGNFDGARDIALLFAQSGWNLRHLGLNVGMGGPVTVFAPIGGSWEQVPIADQERLRTEGWTLHGNDVLKYIMVQGVYEIEDLYRIYQEEGRSYSLTTLNGEDISVDYDAGLDGILINGGMINVANLVAVDGTLHLTEHIPIPLSLSQSVYRVAKVDTDVNAHIKLVEDNSQDLQLVLDIATPVTALLVMNDVWGGKAYNTDNITESILKSHIFEDQLYSCDKLIELQGSTLTSINGLNWTLSVHSETGLPCFDYVGDAEPGLESFQSCVSKCNILGKNGIAHAMSGILAPPGVIQTLAPSSMPSQAPTQVDMMAPTASPTSASVWLDYDLDGCLIDLSTADKDSDGAIRRHEFYHLVQSYGKRICYESEQALTRKQQDLFFDIACLCKEEEEAAENCCEGSNAYIDTGGFLFTDQENYKEVVCQKLHAGIGVNCGGNGPNFQSSNGTIVDGDSDNGFDSGGDEEGDGSSGSRDGDSGGLSLSSSISALFGFAVVVLFTVLF